MTELSPRITGTEMEWSITVPRSGGPTGAVAKMSVTALRRHMETHVRTRAHTGSGVQYFLGNGARFYVDFQDHAEYATSEDDSFLGTTANEIAGEQIIRQTIAQPYQDENHIWHHDNYAAIHKRLISENNETWGCHENYAVETSSGIKIEPSHLELLGVHLATRNIFLGAGVLRGDGSYAIAQKSLGLYDDFSKGTTGKSKPLVNLRDEPQADSRQWLRVHVTSGDATMSPWATRMKFGTTSLVLRLLEHDESLEQLRFNLPLHLMAQSVATDTKLGDTYQTKSGEALSALDTQRQLVQAVGRLARQVALPEEELWTLDQWEKACADMSQHPSLLRNRVDWIMKQSLLEQMQQRRGLSWTSAELRGIDRHWDRVDKRGAGLAMRESVFSEWMPPMALIADRLVHPSRTTRAYTRGTFVQAVSGTPNVASVGWDFVSLNSQRVALPHPNEPHNVDVSNMIRHRLVA